MEKKENKLHYYQNSWEKENHEPNSTAPHHSLPQWKFVEMYGRVVEGGKQGRVNRENRKKKKKGGGAIRGRL